MQEDPFYALHEIFAFIASSELHFLKTIASQIDGNCEVSLKSRGRDPLDMHGNLSYYRHMLGARFVATKKTVNFIKNRGDLDWPQARSDTADSAAIRLENDFQYLLQHTRLLQERCESEMSTLMNNAALSEAHRSLQEGRRAVKLTVLATMFVPLAFTSSIFGMNFVEFKENTQGLLIWIVVSVPVFLMSLTIVTWDPKRMSALFEALKQPIWSTKTEVSTPKRALSV
jgi:Mg2+ and Co2+ transporter CorA